MHIRAFKGRCGVCYKLEGLPLLCLGSTGNLSSRCLCRIFLSDGTSLRIVFGESILPYCLLYSAKRCVIACAAAVRRRASGILSCLKPGGLRSALHRSRVSPIPREKSQETLRVRSTDREVEAGKWANGAGTMVGSHPHPGNCRRQPCHNRAVGHRDHSLLAKGRAASVPGRRVAAYSFR